MNRLMPDREKVIKGMAVCVPQTDADAGLSCDDCPYGWNCGEHASLPVKMIEDIRALLKADKPRLLQAADFQRDDAGNGGEIPCWKEAKSPTRRSGWAVIVYGKWLADEGTARYWTGKPTDEQREATPWL